MTFPNIIVVSIKLQTMTHSGTAVTYVYEILPFKSRSKSDLQKPVNEKAIQCVLKVFAKKDRKPSHDHIGCFAKARSSIPGT
ncbi:hypothetical protein L596_011580 [Steinernema carpocapsae]|uniref:Uncharacterized protein n=1 Tax=Steinernema carpocapsae TaxID=34508 RepID=A0A4U5NV83_STECR|nr:hypothetical protein L596_011580 [Steinernema carpocapsae]